MSVQFLQNWSEGNIDYLIGHIAEFSPAIEAQLIASSIAVANSPINGRTKDLRGVLTSTTQTINVSGMHKGNVTLNSVDVSKLIEFSTDGTLYFQPAYATSHPNQLIAAFDSNINFVKLTGAVGNTYIILSSFLGV